MPRKGKKTVPRGVIRVIDGPGHERMPDEQVVPVRSLHLDTGNLRGHGEAEISLLMKSLEMFGQTKPLLVDSSTMTVKVGNGRLMAMMRLGWTECRCVLMDWRECGGLEVMDNRLAELSSWSSKKEMDGWFADKGDDWWGFDAETALRARKAAERRERAARKEEAGESVDCSLDTVPSDSCSGAPGQPSSDSGEPDVAPRCPCCGAPLVKKDRMVLD